jgi:predicted deacetylase
MWRKREIANKMYVEHLHDRIKYGDETLFKAYEHIEQLEKQLDRLEMEMNMLTTALRDLEIKLNSKAPSNFVVM